MVEVHSWHHHDGAAPHVTLVHSPNAPGRLGGFPRCELLKDIRNRCRLRYVRTMACLNFNRLPAQDTSAGSPAPIWRQRPIESRNDGYSGNTRPPREWSGLSDEVPRVEQFDGAERPGERLLVTIVEEELLGQVGCGNAMTPRLQQAADSCPAACVLTRTVNEYECCHCPDRLAPRLKLRRARNLQAAADLPRAASFG